MVNFLCRTRRTKARKTMTNREKEKERKENQKHICQLVHAMKIGTKGIVEVTHFSNIRSSE